MYPSLYADVHAMTFSNLARRGHLFWWRRKITVAGVPIPIDLPLATTNPYVARAIAERLGTALEQLRMTYGERGKTMDPAVLKRIFQDAMRWQLDRIRRDQIGSTIPVGEHRRINRVYAELWRHQAAQGADAYFTEEDSARLLREGWPSSDIALLEQEVSRQNGHLVALRQLQSYAERFGFELTPANRNRVRQVVMSGRAAACEAANGELGKDAGDLSHWAEEALSIDTPFIFDEPGSRMGTADLRSPTHAPKEEAVSPEKVPTAPSTTAAAKAKKLLKTAAEECIAAYEKAQAWSVDTVEQVNTAIRLFDYACGTDVSIEDINKQHALAFSTLCDSLPNRWGRTREEKVGGIRASLERASKMDPSMLGMSQPTKNKHLTWITTVLGFAASQKGGEHEPSDAAAVEKAIRELRKGLGKKGAKPDRKRARDLRKAWSTAEIKRLLSAPIWLGCCGLDQRFRTGEDVYHDAWYWLPLMMILYGGRSSELVGLPISDTFENAAIPHFRVDYTDLRPLKNVQSVRSLPIHPELIRLGFIDYVAAMRAAGHKLLFPEMRSAASKSFAGTFYKSVFKQWRDWAFPDGTSWRHQMRGAMKDKDVHSFRGTASSLMKGKVQDSVRIDILGHEGANETMRSYDEEAPLEDKLAALEWLSPLTSHIEVKPLRVRPEDRQRFGARRGRTRQA